MLVLLAPRGRVAHDRLAPLVAQEMARIAAQAPGVDLGRLTGLLGDLLGALGAGPRTGSHASDAATVPGGSVPAGGAPRGA